MQNLHNLHNSKLKLYLQFLIVVIAFIALYKTKSTCDFFFNSKIQCVQHVKEKN